MNQYIKELVKKHALKENPNECCGFVCVNYLGQVTVLKCENTARNKTGRFCIDPKMNLEAEKLGHIAAFYHSHCDTLIRPELEKFSKEDLDISYECCIPALLYSHPQDAWKYYDPDTYKPAKLIGRPFVWGIWDCYSLVRDYYKMNRKVKLGYYFPPVHESISGDFGYEQYLKNENFKEVNISDLKKDDVILFKIKSDFINHSAIYLGGNEFLHQPINKISSVSMLDERYLKYIQKTVRYRDE